MDTREINSTHFRYWIWLIGGILSGGSFIVSTSVQICGNSFLKWLLVVIILFVLVAFFYELWVRQQAWKFIFKLGMSIFCFLVTTFFIFYIFSQKCSKEDKEKTSLTTNNNGQYAGAIVNNQPIDNSTNIVNNKPEQRTLTTGDINKLKDSLQDKEERILVMYLDSKIEDTLLFGQICRKLNEMGYSDVSPSPASVLPANLQKGRISFIRKTDQIKVIVNPQ